MAPAALQGGERQSALLVLLPLPLLHGALLYKRCLGSAFPVVETSTQRTRPNHTERAGAGVGASGLRTADS